MKGAVAFLALLAITCTFTYPENCVRPDKNSITNQVTPNENGRTYYYVFTTTECGGELQNFVGEYISQKAKAKPLVTWKKGSRWHFKCEQ